MKCVILCSPSAQVVGERAARDVPLLLEVSPADVSFELRPIAELAEPIRVDEVFRSQRVIDLLKEEGVAAVVFQYPLQRGNTPITARLGIMGATLGNFGDASGTYAPHEGWACWWRRPASL